MGIQIIKHKTNFLRMGRMLLNERLHKVGPVNCGALISHLGIALASSWFKGHENIRRAIALLLNWLRVLQMYLIN